MLLQAAGESTNLLFTILEITFIGLEQGNIKYIFANPKWRVNDLVSINDFWWFSAINAAMCLIFKNLSILKIFIQIFGIFDSLCPNFDFMYHNFALFCTNYSFLPMLCFPNFLFLMESRQNDCPLLFPKFRISIGIPTKCLPPEIISNHLISLNSHYSSLFTNPYLFLNQNLCHLK